MTRTWLLLGAGAGLMVAGSATAQTPVTAGSGIRITKDNAASASSATEVSAGDVTLMPEFDLTAYANRMTEGNIAAHLVGGDSLEISIARLAQTKATDSRVRDYATMLLNDHSAHLNTTLNTIADEDVANVPFPNDIEAQRSRQLLANLTSMAAGSAWDATFVRAQVEHHQHEIDLLNANEKNAHDDDFEELLEDTVESLTKHRDAGRSLATTIGISLY